MDIKKRYSEGWLPAPGETEEQFELRVKASLEFAAQLREGEAPEGLPFIFENQYQPVPAWDSVREMYGFAPDWTPVFVSKKKLPFWQGGALWILTLDNPSVDVGCIQLRAPNLEWETHELAHVPRMAFPEADFEEFFTYRTSASVWRRYLGPLFASGQEASLYLLSSIVIILVSLYLGFELGLYFPIFFLGFLGIRLLKRHQVLSRCLRNLDSIALYPWRVAYGLTDEEIRLFARSSPIEISDYIRRQKELRWKFLSQWMVAQS